MWPTGLSWIDELLFCTPELFVCSDAFISMWPAGLSWIDVFGTKLNAEVDFEVRLL